MNIEITQTPGTNLDQDLKFDICLTEVDYECMLILEQVMYFYMYGQQITRDTRNWGPAPEIEEDKLEFMKTFSQKIIDTENSLRR
jgi:hypothetical protein